MPPTSPYSGNSPLNPSTMLHIHHIVCPVAAYHPHIIEIGRAEVAYMPNTSRQSDDRTPCRNCQELSSVSHVEVVRSTSGTSCMKRTSMIHSACRCAWMKLWNATMCSKRKDTQRPPHHCIISVEKLRGNGNNKTAYCYEEEG